MTDVEAAAGSDKHVESTGLYQVNTDMKGQAHEEDVKTDVHTQLYDGVQRRMEQRHMQMIALAGTIGTGLFLNSGRIIAHGGPVGALLAFILTGTIAYSTLMCLGEMAIYAPISGGYIHFAERWVNPAVGFAMGWQVSIQYCISAPSEMIAANILVSFWDEGFAKSHQAAYITAFIVVAGMINYFGVRWFGESEFIFATMKILLVIILIITALVIDLGGGPKKDRIGFRYWKDPGPFAPYFGNNNTGKFLGWFTNLVQAAGSYMGIEMVIVAAAEVKNPRVSLRKAVKRLFWRIVIFYILLIFLVSLIVRYDDPKLLQSTGTSASSPFVLAMTRAGISGLPHFVNICVLLSAFSSGSSLMYSASRMIYGMALRGYAPRFFARTTRSGLPVVALTFVNCFMPLAYMSLNSGASTVFNWFSNLTALSGYVVWGMIGVTYLRFKKGVEAHGINRKEFHYYNRAQPFTAYWVILWAAIILFFNGWKVFTHGNWNPSDFVISYIPVPIFLCLVTGYWLVRRPKWLRPEELDMFSNIPTDEMVAYDEPPPQNAFMKVVNLLFT